MPKYLSEHQNFLKWHPPDSWVYDRQQDFSAAERLDMTWNRRGFFEWFYEVYGIEIDADRQGWYLLFPYSGDDPTFGQASAIAFKLTHV